MEAFINQLIQDQKKLYSDSYHQVVRDYNEEVSTVKGYNGRQLFELLQNCDDEGSKEVVIELNTGEKTISIANNGTPFSERGYRSLFIANLSPKSATRKYIGNKGLGFRSIINWSTAIEIQSNNISLFYSEQNRCINFQELFDDEKIAQIRDEYGFNNMTFPMPFLSIPLVNEINKNEFVTTIIIHYEEDFYEDIIEQVKNITAETLLFLRNIQQVKFLGFENRDNITCLKENINVNETRFTPRQQVVYEDSSWEIFEEDEELPEEYADKDKKEKEHYQIKIAVEENLHQNTPFLYSFFPTNIRLNQPYILHATFDLASTRNQIENSTKNKFILGKVVEFTIKVAKYYTSEKVSYRPLQILNHKHYADSLMNLGYYELVNKAIATEDIFPCIDGTYKKMNEVVYLNDGFENMLTKIGASRVLGFHLLPLGNLDIKEMFSLSRISNGLNGLKNALDLINEIAALPLNFGQRALFISKVVKDCSFLKINYPNKLNFLVNEDGNIINGSEYIYTPVTQNERLKTPSFTKIQFIHKDLFDELLNQLNYKSTENSVKSRFLYDQLSGYCNIHSYEPATLSQKIISETNNRIKHSPETALVDVKEMNDCLFSNFRKLDNDTKGSPLRVRVPTISLKGNIKDSDDVVFSFHFPLGKKTSKIFEDVYTDDDYVTGPSELGLYQIEDIQEVQLYLKWLGVQQFAKYIPCSTKNELVDYRDYLVKIKNLGRFTAYDINYTDIVNFQNIVSKLSINHLLAWIYFDDSLKRQLNDINNTDIFKYHYYEWYHVLDIQSYLKYQLTIKYGKNFNDFLIDERFAWVNNTIIDYRAEIFLVNEISKTSINEILMLLGAKDDFNLLSIERITEIINKLPDQYPDGKRSQGFYKKALSHYKINKQELKTAVKLFADDGNGLKIYDQGAIYFSDKVKLPNQLKKEFPLFNFPLRSGGAEAIKFFKINDLKEVKIEIKLFEKIQELSADFNDYFNKLKPLILTQRLSDIEEQDQQKEQASICNKIEIILCSGINYQVNGKDYEVADYEFLQVTGYVFYVKVNPNDTLKTLRENPYFIESFADIISVSFDISGEKNEFKYLLRNDYDDAFLSAKNDFGEDAIQEARSLLGLSDYKQAFWFAVFTAKGIDFEEHCDDKKLEILLKKNLNIEYKVSVLDYENLNNPVELNKMESLFESINLTLKDFATHYQYNICMEQVHSKILQNEILKKKKIIKSSVWYRLQESSISEKAQYLSTINELENYHAFVKDKSIAAKHSFYLDVEFLVKEFILAIYGEIIYYNKQNPDNIKEANLKKFSSDEQNEILQNERFKSLLFFDDAIETIKSEIKKEDEEEPFKEVQVNTEDNSIEIVSSDKLLPKLKIAGDNGRKGVFTPKEPNRRKQKEKGNSSEKIVFDYLSKKYEAVYWASQDNEGLHYDIRYINEENVLKYVDAKTFDNGNFHLSKAEYDFGIDNKEDYEIWLVQHQQKIIPIKDFFTNDKYEAVANEYLVHLTIIEN